MKKLDYSGSKNFALSKCKYDWTLNIDADEVLSDKLISSLGQFLDSNSDGINGLSFNRKSFSEVDKSWRLVSRYNNRVSRKGMAKWEGA